MKSSTKVAGVLVTGFSWVGTSWAPGGWGAPASQLCAGVPGVPPSGALQRPAFYKPELGFTVLNQQTLKEAEFPSQLHFSLVKLSVEDTGILAGSKWTKVEGVQSAVKADQTTYLCPTAADGNTSFWIEVKLGAEHAGTQLWAFKSIPAPRTGISTVKFCTLNVGYVPDEIKDGRSLHKLKTVAQWVPQTFRTCSPGGFSPVLAIVHDNGQGKRRFLAVKMQLGGHHKILMHCDTLPSELHTGDCEPNWN